MRTWIAAALVALLGVAVSAQSLADVARQEEARRKALTEKGEKGKVYTNDSLKPAPAPEPAPTPAAAPATQPAAAPDADKAKSKDDDKAADAKKDEETWRKRVATERDALDRANTFADALQSRINALANDFAARDDPFQRQQIANDRQKALTELDRVKQEIQQHTKAITDIQEEARRAGVPAGWVR